MFLSGRAGKTGLQKPRLVQAMIGYRAAGGRVTELFLAVTESYRISSGGGDGPETSRKFKAERSLIIGIAMDICNRTQLPTSTPSRLS